MELATSTIILYIVIAVIVAYVLIRLMSVLAQIGAICVGFIGWLLWSRHRRK